MGLYNLLVTVVYCQLLSRIVTKVSQGFRVLFAVHPWNLKIFA